MENLKRQIQVAVDAFKSQRILEAEELTKKLISENPNIKVKPKPTITVVMKCFKYLFILSICCHSI